jgi:hypothetical protein
MFHSETATARVALSEDGILIVRIHQGMRQTPADALDNLTATRSVAAGRRRPLLVDITGSPPLDAETRHLYSGKSLAAAFTALALLVEGSPLGPMMGNVYLRVARPGIPTRVFIDESKAHSWLKGYLP